MHANEKTLSVTVARLLSALGVSGLLFLGGCEGLDPATLMQATTILSDPTGQAYNDAIFSGVVRSTTSNPVSNPVSYSTSPSPTGVSGSTGATGSSNSGAGAVTPGSYPTKPNILAGNAACQGYTIDNYMEYFDAHSNGVDTQLHTMCAAAYNYYSIYLNAIRQGYTEADSNQSYDAFQRAARTAISFYQNSGGGIGF